MGRFKKNINHLEEQPPFIILSQARDVAGPSPSSRRRLAELETRAEEEAEELAVSYPTQPNTCPTTAVAFPSSIVKRYD